MKRLLSILLLTVLGLYFAGCEMQPSTPVEGIALDPEMQKLAVFGWDANRVVSSSEEVDEVTNISQMLEEEDTEGLPGLGSMKRSAADLFHSMRFEEIPQNSLRKTLADTLLFFEDNKLTGVRKALYYDPETGIARFYEVKTKFAGWQKLTYDSSQVIVDLNFTILNPADDVLKNFYQMQLFEESFFVQKIVNDIDVTDVDGSEVTGVEGSRDAYYRSDRHLTHLRQSVDLNPDKSGTLRDDFEFKDGKSSYRSVTFYPDNTGTFSKQLRDGTKVTGAFNSLEDDGIGSYQELIDLPEGRRIDEIEKSADVVITLPDSIVTMDLVETILFATGISFTDSAQIVSHEQFGVKTSDISFYKHNGEHGTFHIVENEGGSTLDGNWTTIEGHYILVTAEYYIDGSGHLHYDGYESEEAYRDGADPIFVADYYFLPDGAGTGNISYKGDTYEIAFDENGDANITNEEGGASISLFQ